MKNYSISTLPSGYGHRKVTLHTYGKNGSTQRSFVTSDMTLTDALTSDKKYEVERAEIICRRKAIAVNKND